MNIFYPKTKLVSTGQFYVLHNEEAPAQDFEGINLPTLTEVQFANNDYNTDSENPTIVTAAPTMAARHRDEDINLLLTADDEFDDIKALLAHIHRIVIYVTDFKDGRIFSLIRQINQSKVESEIWVCGQYGVDQVAYLSKIGVSAFVADSDKLSVIQQTIDDLQTASDGVSVSALPMFR